MINKHISWLLAELPTLVEQQVIAPDASERLRLHYASYGVTRPGRNWALAISSVIGALLVGGGVILLLAYNWSNLSRPMRTAVAVAPLLIGQIWAASVLARNETGPGRREGAATFVMLALGATMAVVSQLYHLSDDISAFMLTWMILSAPLVYIFTATLPAMLYFIGITSWAVNDHLAGARPELFWILAAVMLPFLWKSASTRRYAATTAWLFWTVAICLCVALANVSHLRNDDAFLAYATLFSVFYLIGRLWFGDAPTMWQRPLHVIGGAGIAVLSIAATYHEAGLDAFAGTPALAVLLAVSATLIAISVVRKEQGNLVFGIMPFLALLTMHPLGMSIVFNIYVFLAAIATIIAGCRRNHVGQFNAGLLLLAILIGCRFFDSDLGFLGRGIAFIALGIGFILANRFMARRKKAAA